MTRPEARYIAAKIAHRGGEAQAARVRLRVLTDDPRRHDCDRDTWRTWHAEFCAAQAQVRARDERTQAALEALLSSLIAGGLAFHEALARLAELNAAFL